MSIGAQKEIALASGVVNGGDARILAGITLPGVAAAIWERPLDPAFSRWIEPLDPSVLPRVRETVAASTVETTILAACDAAGTPACAERAWLAADAASLARTFIDVVGAPFLNMRLEIVRDDACRRFHVDTVRARLVCTYRGSGTEFGAGRVGAFPPTIQRLPTGAAAVFRGLLWPGADVPGIVHRSPPIAGTRETRLLLVFDPVDRLEGRC